MDCREGLKQLESDSIDCVIASPPYWSLRDYNIEPSIWDGDPNCDHDFDINENKNPLDRNESEGKQKYKANSNIYKEGFCNKCGAWQGTLGLEPNFELYIKHLCDIYDQVKRVLKGTGTCWVNLGDTYGTHGSGSKNCSHNFRSAEVAAKEGIGTLPKRVKGFEKCLLMLPQRFAIEMINRGWILRNVIIWHKPNCMPSSARDRFTVDFEQIFLFVKSNKTQYWINEKTDQLISKRPLGTKGIENIDWEWRECDKCLGTGIKHKKCKACEEEGWIYNTLLQPEKCSYCNGLGRIRQDEECKSCKGKGIKKYNLWKGRQYWFEQQRESLKETGWDRWSKKYNVGIGGKRNAPIEIQQNQEYIASNPLGRNKRTVWTIPTKPNPEAHFATFPSALVKPMILSGCPEFVCVECGKPREKIIERIVGDQRPNEPDQKRVKAGVLKGGAKPTTSRSLSDIFAQAISTRIITKGYTDCGCGEGFGSGVVLDPFAGIGTTLKQAWKLGRNYIGFEISEEYCKIANKNLSLTKNIRLDDFIYEKQIEV